MNLPTLQHYGRGEKGHVFESDRLTVWFSYDMPVGFQVTGKPAVVRENEWGPTTGGHIGQIDGGNKASRIPGDEFERLLSKACKAPR